MTQIEYLGWSGFRITLYDGAEIYVDPPKGTKFPDQDLLILITHGHPEHLGGTLDHVRDMASDQQTTIVASKTVCRYLDKECRSAKVNFNPTEPLEVSMLSGGVRITSFEWHHMPLLPPGFIAPIRHTWHILKGFKHTWNILKMSLKGPKGAGVMLGYALNINGESIIIYGEGLHRHCNAADVTFIGAIAPASTILVASEPEDIDDLPALVAASGAAKAIVYEPHRPWRDLYQLPHIDLEKLQQKINDRGIKTTIAI